MDPVTDLSKRGRDVRNRRVCGGFVRSGRLDLNQRPFGPQPDGSRFSRAYLGQRRGFESCQIVSVPLTLDPELDPALGSVAARLRALWPVWPVGVRISLGRTERPANGRPKTVQSTSETRAARPDR
jgi:hypothetical protein